MKNLKKFNELNESFKPEEIRKIARKTETAYSVEEFKDGEWEKLIKFFGDKGYSPNEVEEIMQSKEIRLGVDRAGREDKGITAKKFIDAWDLSAEKRMDTELGKPDKFSSKRTELNKAIHAAVSKFEDQLPLEDIQKSLMIISKKQTWK